MARIEVPGGVVEVEQRGRGRDLVLLHSLLIDRSAFARIVPLLEPHFRLHLVALPGFDGSSPAGPRVEDYADRIGDLLRALRLGTQTAVLGNGFGGFVAIALAARHGSLFDRLLLVDTAAGFPAAAKEAFRIMADKVAAGGMGAVAEIAARRIFHDAYLAAHPKAVAERRAVLERFNPDAFVSACRALEQVELRPVLPKIANPTLVVVGALDAATPLPLARELADGIPGAGYIELPGCGHCPPLEQPDAFLDAVASFIRLPRPALG
jgi:pimeloyl-ACP methyl ester carboxylesterase